MAPTRLLRLPPGASDPLPRSRSTPLTESLAPGRAEEQVEDR